jgi:hypothetical protein
LIRLIVSLDIELPIDLEENESIDKFVELNSWYDRENLLNDELNPQNIFLNRNMTTNTDIFIRTDPFIDKVLLHKIKLIEEYLKSFEKYLSSGKDFEKIKYSESKLVKIDNITPNLKEIFKYFNKFDNFNKQINESLNINIDAFHKSKNSFS